MLIKKAHLSESDLVLAADGELPPKRRSEVMAHLETCWACRERKQSLENTISAFVRARNRELEGQLRPIAGPRALLRARLAESAAASPPLFSRVTSFWRLAPAAGVFFSVLLLLFGLFEASVNAEGSKPRSGITPGEARAITMDEVCRLPEAEPVAGNIPEEMRRKVFAAYGIRSPGANQFEVDFLITPDLGGTVSARNLWPQSYSARWNARVKDKLEQRLHHLVCEGKLDLSTAQREMATDWIRAYKKYVGENVSR